MKDLEPIEVAVMTGGVSRYNIDPRTDDLYLTAEALRAQGLLTRSVVTSAQARDIYYHLTPLGHLALRVHAAAGGRR